MREETEKILTTAREFLATHENDLGLMLNQHGESQMTRYNKMTHGLIKEGNGPTMYYIGIQNEEIVAPLFEIKDLLKQMSENLAQGEKANRKMVIERKREMKAALIKDKKTKGKRK